MTTMPLTQQIFTIGICILATVLTRFLPFLIFRGDKKTPDFIKYLGDALPSAIFGMLVIYCMKDVNITAPNHALPDFIAIFATFGLHLWRRNMFLSIIGGTVVYVVLLGVM